MKTQTIETVRPAASVAIILGKLESHPPHHHENAAKVREDKDVHLHRRFRDHHSAWDHSGINE